MASPASSPDRDRFISRSGELNFVALGRKARPLADVYHFLVRGSWWRLLLLVVCSYLAANALFASAYLLEPGGVEAMRPGSFEDAFFFSVQTMATIGYGKMAPVSKFAHLLVTFEALTGLIGLALATGLVFAKFSRPTARVLFSDNAVVCLHDGVPSLMFRLANERANQVVEAQLTVSLARSEKTAEGMPFRRFYELELVRGRTPIFALTWTIIHPIGPRSPLHGWSQERLAAARAELICSFTGLDETVMQTVHARHSYVAAEIVWDMRLVDILGTREDGRRTIDYTKFHELVPAPFSRQAPPD